MTFVCLLIYPRYYSPTYIHRFPCVWCILLRFTMVCSLTKIKYVEFKVRLHRQSKQFRYIMGYGQKLFKVHFNDVILLQKIWNWCWYTLQHVTSIKWCAWHLIFPYMDIQKNSIALLSVDNDCLICALWNWFTLLRCSISPYTVYLRHVTFNALIQGTKNFEIHNRLWTTITRSTSLVVLYWFSSSTKV